MFANCAFFHPANVNQMFRRDDYTNPQFPHLPILPPPYQPPLMLTMVQILVDLQNKLTAMDNTNPKDTGGFESHPGAFQQTTELLAQEEQVPPLSAVNLQREDNSNNSNAISVPSERISKLDTIP